MGESRKSKEKVADLVRVSNLPPLADPVFAQICDGVETIGLGLESFVNAVLVDSGAPPISSVVEVTPQRIGHGQGFRSYRVDVVAATETGERVLVEVQSSSFESMNQRSMLYVQSNLDRGSKRGEKLEDVIGIPRIVVGTS
jgi:hypothetical protein